MQFTSFDLRFILKLYIYLHEVKKKCERYNLIYKNQIAKQAIERFYLYEKENTISR